MGGRPELRQLIINAEQEIENINTMYVRENFNLDSLRQELLSLRSQNLEEASFEEKAELIASLGVKVIPAEDLKTRRICCRLNLENTQKKGGENGLTKVTFGGAGGIRTPYLLNAIQALSQLSYGPTRDGCCNKRPGACQ